MKDGLINKALYNMIYIDICGFPQPTRKSSDKLNHLPMDEEYKAMVWIPSLVVINFSQRSAPS